MTYEPRVITGKDMLRELNLPAYIDVDFINSSQKHFEDAMERFTEYYKKAASGKVESGKQGFAIRYLFARCINDLVTGYHLVSHGYIIQFYSITRGVLESLDKIELFGRRKAFAHAFLLDQLNYFEKFMVECSQPAFKKYGGKLETGMEPIIQDLTKLKEKLGNIEQ